MVVLLGSRPHEMQRGEETAGISPPGDRLRRVGATLPIEICVGFKAYIARNGITGEQVIVAATERPLPDA
jgi:hypothetical protein